MFSRHLEADRIAASRFLWPFPDL